MNTRGEASNEWTLSKVVTLILLLILLVLIIVGVVSGKLIPLFERVGGASDSIEYRLNEIFGSSQSHEIVEPNLDCVIRQELFSIDDAKVPEMVTLKNCFGGSLHQCELTGLPSNSRYLYYPDTGELVANHEGLGGYTVSLESEMKTADTVYFDAIEFLYHDVFSVERRLVDSVNPEDAANQYSYQNYIGYDMDDYFGSYGSMVVLYDTEGNNYFMAAGGRYLVFNAEQSATGSSFGSLSRVNPVTPYTHGQGSWIYYYGTDVERALDSFKGLVWGYVNDYDLEAVLCDPIKNAVIYPNCHYTQSVSSDSFENFMNSISGSLTPGGDLNQFDRDVDYQILSNYLSGMESGVLSGSTKISNPASALNNLFLQKGATTFTSGDTVYSVQAVERSDSLPLLKVTSSDSSKTYYLRFDGVNQFRKPDTDIFATQRGGRLITAPFVLLDSSFKPLPISRELELDDSLNSLDRKAYDFMLQYCRG